MNINDSLNNKMEDYRSVEEIHSWLIEHGVENFHINEDFTVDVEGNVNISNKNLTHIPIQFGMVSGSFFCDTNQLTSLKGCPKSVGGVFSCYRNILTTLEYCPTHTSSFLCGDNKLTTLKFAPKIIRGQFECCNNELTSLEGCPHSVAGTFDCSGNKISSLKFSPQVILGNFYCFNNELTSLEFSPHIVMGEFNCNNNKIRSLLTDLEEANIFECTDNPIISLEDFTTSVRSHFKYTGDFFDDIGRKFNIVRQNDKRVFHGNDLKNIQKFYAFPRKLNKELTEAKPEATDRKRIKL